MPGLPKRRNRNEFNADFDQHEAEITSLPLPPKSLASTKMTTNTKYIAPQMDPLAGSTTQAARESPLRLMIRDAGVLLTMLPYMANIFLPLKANAQSYSLFLDVVGMRDIVLQSWLFIMEISLLIAAPPVLLILPGIISLTAIGLCCLTVYLTTWLMQGPNVIYSNMDEATEATAEKHRDERWLFVNGTATSYSGLQKNVDRISTTFGRAVIGIHNKTYGLPADMLECLVQRSFAYKTQDVRVAYSSVKAVLADPTVKKVVLIGHSQGGIIVSLVLDELFAELPTSCMSKLEIYTFGSAASHFSNPLTSLATEGHSSVLPTSASPVRLDLPPQSKHVISHIEHYANERDLVPRWGVLHCVQDILNNRYAGSVFVRMGASGHMFNQHYMDAMFPLPKKDAHSMSGTFLDNLVKVDEKLATMRENIAVSKIGVMRRDSGLEFGNGQLISDGLGAIHDSSQSSQSRGNTIMTFARTNTGRLLAEEAQGKTVRELSRLWRYQGGRSPHEPIALPFVNGEARLMNGKHDKSQGFRQLTSISTEESFSNGNSSKGHGGRHHGAMTDLS